MKAIDALEQAWTKAEGEVFSDAVGSDNWNTLLTYANFYIGQWTTHYGVDWNSLYDPMYKVAVVTTAIAYDLDVDDVRKISNEKGDTVRILHTDGTSYTEYTLVPPNQLWKNFTNKACAKVGASLKFSHPFATTDPEFGGTIYAPVYGTPALLKNDKSDIPVDDPVWLICKVAYEVALHDILRKDISTNLASEADDAMKSMKWVNNSSQDNKVNQADLSFIGSNNSTGSNSGSMGGIFG